MNAQPAAVLRALRRELRKAKFHLHRVVIGVRELGIDDAACQYGNIVRNEEAVEGDLEVRLRVPRGVRVAAARHRIVRVERRDQTKAVRDVLCRQRLCSRVCLSADPKDLRAVA